MKLKRYTICIPYRSREVAYLETPNGEWVQYEEVESFLIKLYAKLGIPLPKPPGDKKMPPREDQDEEASDELPSKKHLKKKIRRIV